MVMQLKVFSYYVKIFSFLMIFTLICIALHIMICLNINELKINIHDITRNYLVLELVFPILYILLAISVYNYSTTLDSSRNILIVLIMYLLILLLIFLSSFLFFRYANFIFAFWLSIICIVIDGFMSILFLKSPICNFHFSILVYLAIVEFYFYYAII